MDTEGGRQRRKRRKKKKVNKVHEEVKSSKSSRRQRMAAQLAVRKSTPDTVAQGGEGAVGVSACVVWMLNNNNNNNGKKKIIIRKWSLFVSLLQNLSRREKSYGARVRDQEQGKG